VKPLLGKLADFAVLDRNPCTVEPWTIATSRSSARSSAAKPFTRRGREGLLRPTRIYAGRMSKAATCRATVAGRPIRGARVLAGLRVHIQRGDGAHDYDLPLGAAEPHRLEPGVDHGEVGGGLARPDLCSGKGQGGALERPPVPCKSPGELGWSVARSSMVRSARCARAGPPPHSCGRRVRGKPTRYRGVTASLSSTGITITVNGVPASSLTDGSGLPNWAPPTIEFS
jgi:hypothetical protein